MSKFKILVSLIFLSVFLLTFTLIKAQDCGSDFQCQIDQIQREIDSLSPAQEKNKQDLADLRAKITDLNKKITNFTNQITKTESNIKTREKDLGNAKILFEEKTRIHYKFLRLYDPILPFLSTTDATEAFREVNFRQKAADSDRQQMEKYASDLSKLKTDKESLERSKQSLASLKTQIAEKEKFLAGEVNKVESYLSSLSAKQQELQALKSGGFSTSVGDTPGTLEPCSGPSGSSNFCDPGFRPAFGGFSFGAPHRTGLSQYGAYGRSKSGQNAENILSAYYQGSSLNKSYSSPSTIGVTGYGRISFEDNYLLGIYEVPESWGDNGGFEALKAQAVATRTYALAVTNNGSGTICPTESCQVYKPQLKSGKWAEAVRATRGWVLTKDGNLAKTYYAASSGGFTITQWGWSGIRDTSGDWPGTAYEKVGGSPWFYKGWYKSRGGSTCGKNNPWLTSEEMADILNAWVVLTSGGDVERVSPIDTSCWGGNPYSKSELSSIGGFTSVTGISVVYSNSGFTQTVNVSTNKGNIPISGDQFKKAFNLRAPGYIGLKSSLFNIEKL
jgi:peptidoglycan hydrolase CwlO-like protein